MAKKAAPKKAAAKKPKRKNLIERIVILNPQVRVDARHIPLNTLRRQSDRPLDRFGSLQEVREAVPAYGDVRFLDNLRLLSLPSSPRCRLRFERSSSCVNCMNSIIATSPRSPTRRSER